jgi:octaprenyl-diphosphate synthase
MTLPLIHVLNTCTLEKILDNQLHKNHNKDKKWVKVIAFVKDNNGFFESKMVEFQQEALLLLDNYSNSDFKEALILMVNYVIEKIEGRLVLKRF